MYELFISVAKVVAFVSIIYVMIKVSDNLTKDRWK